MDGQMAIIDWFDVTWGNGTGIYKTSNTKGYIPGTISMLACPTGNYYYFDQYGNIVFGSTGQGWAWAGATLDTGFYLPELCF